MTPFQLVAVAGFVCLCLLIALSRDAARRRRAVLLLAGYFVTVQLVLGIAQKDAWPFTPYRFMHGLATLSDELWRVGFFGVDEQGREWRVDPYAWNPMPDWGLQWFFASVYRPLRTDQKAIALRHVYLLAERYRASTAARGSLPPPSHLGPLSASPLWPFPRESAVVTHPFKALRVYRETWRTADRLEDPASAVRVLLGEYVSP